MLDLGVVAGYDRVYVMRGYTDLRRGIPSLVASLVAFHGVDPAEERVAYLFCGRTARRVKCLVRERGAYVLASVLLDRGLRVRWPRTPPGLAEVSPAELSRILGRP